MAVKVRTPYRYRCNDCANLGGCTLSCADDLALRIEMEGPDTVAAVFMEPVQNTGGAFTPPEKEAILETPFWKQPGFIDSALEVGKNVMIALLVLYLMLGVLRPMMRRVSEAPASSLAALPGAPGQADGGTGGTLPAPAVDPYDQSLNSAKQIAKQDPRVVANVVKGWVAGNA